jgi:valyl-tRNA synthetase
MAEELSKVYEPGATESLAEEIWNSRPYFHAEAPDGKTGRKPYAIVIPPPNVTAPLHLGHALNNTLQDVLIRYRRMQNYNTLWMPGTDHAGIATQTVVEKRILSEEGKRRTDFEREEFVGRVQAWKDEYEAKIIEQLKAMGCSCDWERTRFTMDPVCARAVRAAFFKLFKDGLIYRGKRLVNWDPATQTVLADDEVEHETVEGHFWYLRYPLVEAVEIPRSTGFQPMVDEVNKRKGAYLPHWTQTGAVYAITIRLADSLGADVAEQMRLEREKIIQNATSERRELTSYERQELEQLYFDKVESYLNAGHGQCYLREPNIAELVANALKKFDGERYDLIAWAVMPNHVHVVVKPFEGVKLPEILHSWKSYTANKANELLGRTGEFWRSEYYDHLIRDEEDLFNQINYVLSNPAKAGLEKWPWVDAKTDIHGQDARDTIEHVTVATTRPETMLGDTAVAMNPADKRAKYLVGKKVRLPIVGRIIPIIADEHVVLPDSMNHGQDARGTDEKAKFSTGFLKVTPAHDPDDWEIGQRHNLAIVNVMGPDGSISDKHGWTDWEEIKNPDVENLIGMDRFEAREAVVEWFRQENLLEDVRPYAHEVGHSYRSHVPIEPYLSDQWYIAVKKPIPSLVQQESTGKMPVAQTIEGTDVPVNSLAGLALKPLIDGRLRFIPERYSKTYQSWLENLRDWPISRQLWWGHRIPVWNFTLNGSEKKYSEAIQKLKAFLQNCGGVGQVWPYRKREDPHTVYVCLENAQDDSILDALAIYRTQMVNAGQEYTPGDVLESGKPTPDRIKSNEGQALDFLKHYVVEEFLRDDDVLDTWFSSALWPFSTMGWPDETAELKTFYPGDVLCTAREIITLWVSRMVMMGQYCVGDIPFSDVYIHAMIQDGEGRKMSKSLGNGIDPLVAINSHGADAMRFTLASMTTDTQDIRMPVEKMKLPDGRVENTSPKFDIGRNFCNKLWNASRFALMNLEGIEVNKFDKDKMTITDRWILSRLAKTIGDVTEQLDEFKYSEPLAQLYRFFWNDLCDWYLEWAKPRMQDEEQKATAQNVLAFVLDQTLRLLHPFIPFITEGIFQKLNEIASVRGLGGVAAVEEAEALVAARWPERMDSFVDESAERDVSIIQDAIRTIRDIRSQYNKAPKEVMVVSAKALEETAKILNENGALIEQLAGVRDFKAGMAVKKPENAAVAVLGDATEVYVHDMIDAEAELKRLEKQRQEVEKAKKAVEAKLGNKNFVKKAKPEVVAQSRERLGQLVEQLETIERHISELDG